MLNEKPLLVVLVFFSHFFNSVNVLPEYHDDPRTVGNLLDGVNHTCEDYHMWLAPFSEGRAHYVHIDFGRCVNKFSKHRVWVCHARTCEVCVCVLF